MNKTHRIASVLALNAFLLGSGTVGHAKDKNVYQTAKLVDLRASATRLGPPRAQYSYCLAIQAGDISYIVSYEPFLRGSFKPTDLIVGDPIDIRIKGDRLYFKTGKESSDDEAKAHITRQQRITPDSKPATCGLHVAVQD